MARTNLAIQNGFTPLNAEDSDFVVLEVASAYGTAIYPGEPVIAKSDGTVERTPAGTAAGAATDGITAVCVDIIQYKDTAGFVRKNAKLLPASTSWTAHHERSLILAVLATEAKRFRIRASAAVASLTAAISARFANADHDYGGTADTGLGLTAIRLNMGTLATTNTLQWRVLGFTDVVYSDPTQASFWVEVMPNLVYGLPVVGGATLGV